MGTFTPVPIVDGDEVHVLLSQLRDIGHLSDDSRPAAQMVLGMPDPQTGHQASNLFPVGLHVLGMVCVDRREYRTWRYEGIVRWIGEDPWPDELPFKPDSYVTGRYDKWSKRGLMRLHVYLLN